MSRPKPREVFDDPTTYISFLTVVSDDEFEGQHYDRKQVGEVGVDSQRLRRQVSDIRSHITETVSAFANRNVGGGLLVLGIASNGNVTGLNHLTEQQKSSLADIDTLLHHQAAEIRFYDCSDSKGNQNEICLIFSPYTKNNICETPGRNPKAWTRSGPQNVPMTQEMRDGIKASKGIVDFERTPCSPFDTVDVDTDVLDEFRKVFHPEKTGEFSTERLLYEAGAIIRDGEGYCWTYAGVLFFAANPQRVLPHAYVRLLRFGVTSDNWASRGLPTYQGPDFKGPVTKQIRDTRTFFRESAFFKRYQTRKQGGGFAEEPELPPNAIDEAIVNAVAHRDYRTGLPIECESYSDAFIVKNAGRLMQREIDLPSHFTLEDTVLNSMPRNPKLLEWLRIMHDPDGVSYMQAISEGTKQMKAEMSALGLPAPAFRLAENETLIKLESNAEARERAMLAATQVKTSEYANLFTLLIREDTKPATTDSFGMRYGDFMYALRDVLKAKGWYIDRFGFSRIIAHRRGTDLGIPKNVSRILHFYPAYEFQVKEYLGTFYLSLDYRCQVLSIQTLEKIAPHFSHGEITALRCVANKDGWREGRICALTTEFASIYFFDSEIEEQVPLTSVIPHCTLMMMGTILRREGVEFDLPSSIKKFSMASHKGAARERAEKIIDMATHIAQTIFPIQFQNFEVRLIPEPVQLVESTANIDSHFRVQRLSEPSVEFREHHASTDVRSGITQYGVYDDSRHDIELIPICLWQYRNNMEQLIERLKSGKFKYKGAERTFSTRFSYPMVITVDDPSGLEREVRRLLSEHAEWSGAKALRRLFLVHTPEQGYSSDDASSPYYVVKRLLLEQGIPCQMVDTPTLLSADWKDLNLALNITAKCGVTPWVLPDAIPHADFFIGLSHTQSSDGQRIMGFANVFNQYGKWEFYSGNTAAFDYEQRQLHLAGLVEATLGKLHTRLSPSPAIVFHYSAKLSHEDRRSILDAARKTCPGGTFSFVWINSHHNIRLFDSRPETDGSLRRGSFVRVASNKIYLSTTGDNPYRKAMGTPKPLELTVWVWTPNGPSKEKPDLRVLAVQVLSLTKLNWASTDSFCGEPITLKYAGDIAYLTAAFLRQSETFSLHPVLENTPWFI